MTWDARNHAESSVSSSDTSSTDSSSLDSITAEQYLAGLASPQHLNHTVKAKKVPTKGSRRKRFVRSRRTRLKKLDEDTGADSDESSETSERYEVIAQLVRRRPRTRLPFIPSDSDSKSELSDSIDSKLLLLVPDTLGIPYPAQVEPSRKRKLEGFLDLLLALSDSSSSER